ncbi:hypothetical protein [Streptomyces sp. x-80]
MELEPGGCARSERNAGVRPSGETRGYRADAVPEVIARSSPSSTV